MLTKIDNGFGEGTIEGWDKDGRGLRVDHVRLLSEKLVDDEALGVSGCTYRLRALLAEWVDLARLRSNAEELFGYEPVWQHLACLAAYTLVTLGLALWIVRSREYPPGSEA